MQTWIWRKMHTANRRQEQLTQVCRTARATCTHITYTTNVYIKQFVSSLLTSHSTAGCDTQLMLSRQSETKYPLYCEIVSMYKMAQWNFTWKQLNHFQNAPTMQYTHTNNTCTKTPRKLKLDNIYRKMHYLLQSIIRYSQLQTTFRVFG